MVRITLIIFFFVSFIGKGQINLSCNGTVTANQFFYANTVSYGAPTGGFGRQLLCGPNTVVYDTLISACYNAYLNPNCTITINGSCPGPQIVWLKSGSVLNVGPNCSTQTYVYFESGAIINNPSSVPITTNSCVSVSFPNSNCITGISEYYYGDNLFQIYPNPSSTKINLELAYNDIKSIDILITNQLGEIVYGNKSLYAGKIEIPVENLSLGLYFIRIKTNLGTQIKKFTILR